MSRNDLERRLRAIPVDEPPEGMDSLRGSILAEAPQELHPASGRSASSPLAVAAAALLLLAGGAALLLATRREPAAVVARALVAEPSSEAAIEEPMTAAVSEPAPGSTPDYAARGRRDPYVSLVPPPAPPPRPRPAPAMADLELHATVNLRKDRYAVFLGKDERCYTLREGDPVANGVLRTIDGDHVTFARNDAAPGAPGSEVVMGLSSL